MLYWHPRSAAQPFHMSVITQTYYYRLDPELKLIHVFDNCRALRMARKYNYMTEFRLRHGDELGALALDKMLNEGWRTCHACWAREKLLAIKDKRRVRPGFKAEPTP